MKEKKFLTENDVAELKKAISEEIRKNVNTEVFRYYNCNPYHQRTADCVIRAIAAGTGYKWEKVVRDLTEYMLNDGNMMNTQELYSRYLKDNGWVQHKQPKTKGGKNVKFKDFVKTFRGKAISNCGDSHVTYVSGGVHL